MVMLRERRPRGTMWKPRRPVTMHAEQALLLGSTVATFGVCCLVANRAASYFADSHWILRDYSNATQFMDYGAVITFVLGLVLSCGLLYLFSGPSKPVLSKEEWRSFKLIQKTPVSRTSAM